MEQSDRIDELLHELERSEREYIHPLWPRVMDYHFIFINLYPVAYVKPQ